MHLYIDKCIPWRESERNAWAVFTTLPQEQTQPIFRGFISISGWRVVLCKELVCHSWRESPCITYTAHNNIFNAALVFLFASVCWENAVIHNERILDVSLSESNTSHHVTKKTLDWHWWHIILCLKILFLSFFSTLQSDRMVSVLTVVTYMKKKTVFKKKMMKWTRL